jgi:para-aminobenzoate synthetase component 1
MSVLCEQCYIFAKIASCLQTLSEFTYFLLLETLAPDSRGMHTHLCGAAGGDAFKIHSPDLIPGGKLLMGHIGYDLKNSFEKLESNHPNSIGFPEMLLFEPEVMLQPEEIAMPSNLFTSGEVHCNFTRAEYLHTIEQLLKHIHRGDIYEITFCIEFTIDSVECDPLGLYRRLTRLSPMPFSAFYKCGEKYLICASPERWLAGRGKHLFSQPIKGTIRRGVNEAEDKRLKALLRQDIKERSENVMIVDLVRNDLSRIAVPGSVRVDELFGIYTFPGVHQMISTISCDTDRERTLEAGLRATFPPGSMTGAPKIRAMQLIEEFERHKRGLFSGSVGYCDVEGNFDFNVVIRSIQYNRETGKLSFSVGSAITSLSDPEKEYEECLLKAGAIFRILQEKS